MLVFVIVCCKCWLMLGAWLSQAHCLAFASLMVASTLSHCCFCLWVWLALFHPLPLPRPVPPPLSVSVVVSFPPCFVRSVFCLFCCGPVPCSGSFGVLLVLPVLLRSCGSPLFVFGRCPACSAVVLSFPRVWFCSMVWRLLPGRCKFPSTCQYMSLRGL